MTNVSSQRGGQLRIRHDAETLALQPHATYQEHTGRCRGCQQPPRSAMEPYWTTVFTQPATVTMPECTQHLVQDSIASPIKAKEIRAARPSLAVSPDPDGLTARQFRAIPLGIIVRIFITLSSGERICPNTWQSQERSSSSRNLRLLCLENSDLSPSPLSLLGSYIRY